MSTQVLPPPSHPSSHPSPANDNGNSNDLPHSRPTSALRNKAPSPPHDSADNGHRGSESSGADGNGSNGMNINIPPTKPFKRVNHLSFEQNPFEFSFSQQSSTNSVPAVSNKITQNHLHQPTSPRATRDVREQSDVGRAGSSPKPTLPPLSSLAEPTQESSNSFPWGFSAALHDASSSLRSGPLSPAMLPGPTDRAAPHDPSTQPTQSQHNAGGGPGYFDGHFRTGLTPGIGRTGLTPLVGGPASFPPPSPNTAAFLAMATNGNGTNGAQQAISAMTAGATITPNTLSAIAGSLMSQAHAAAANGGGSDHHGGHHQQQHGPSRLSNSHVPAYPPTQSQHPPSSYANNSDMNGGGYPNQIENYQGAAQNTTATAANGLFLLSQAHQELTKREEQQQAEAAANAASANNTRGAAAARRGSTNVVAPPIVQAAAASHSKRKSTDTGKAPAGKRARGATTGTVPAPTRASGRRKNTAPQPNYGESPPDMDEDASMDEDDEMMMSGMRGNSMSASGGGPTSPTNANKKPETEEEKRKNFLERNRQAALKCRQRKKAWLGELQKRVEFLTSENERLQGTIVSMRDEVTRLSAVVVAHRSCGLGGVVVPGYAGGATSGSSSDQHHGHVPVPGSPADGSEISIRSPLAPSRREDRHTSPISVAPVSVPVSVPLPNSSVVAASPVATSGPGGAGGAEGGGGYGY
ncbi:hypothetical protein FRB93_010458 [Tulasnella sp. JGI-2019a]|nr:hypothetical protein FRB93_010458 [Tulasnella sp. JGI-2019a]